MRIGHTRVVLNIPKFMWRPACTESFNYLQCRGVRLIDNDSRVCSEICFPEFNRINKVIFSFLFGYLWINIVVDSLVFICKFY